MGMKVQQLAHEKNVTESMVKGMSNKENLSSNVWQKGWPKQRSELLTTSEREVLSLKKEMASWQTNMVDFRKELSNVQSTLNSFGLSINELKLSIGVDIKTGLQDVKQQLKVEMGKEISKQIELVK